MSSVAERMAEVVQELYARKPENQMRPRLEPTRLAVELMGNPQHAYPVIHLTGTNGKTSTARIIERILREMGLKTGRVTSPHLISFNERISLDGDPVSDELFVENYEQNKPLLDLIDAQLAEQAEAPLTFFEAFTALSFQLFADAPIDVLVLEVGIGGEWDSTNVADGDVAVFTPIDLDHTKTL
ncbi:MAG: bifunctional folylpolyglutamate synthase/dihydrofolate synthase, partial [Aquiluna sp.]